MLRARLSQLFEYLKAYSDLRYPPVRDIRNQLGTLWIKDLPPHPSIELRRDEDDAAAGDDDAGVVLRLTRPTLTPCPAPPAVLVDWLKPGWRDSAGTVEVQASRNVVGRDGKTRFERFEADSQRPTLLRSWQEDRQEWAENERPVRAAMGFFQRVYEWYGTAEREGERIELLVADGLLRCPASDGVFHHPVLLQKLELEFYPESRQPQFVFRKREQPPELYMARRF